MAEKIPEDIVIERTCPDCGGRKKHAGGRPATPLADRFWAFVQKGPDCWMWVGPVSRRHGYGKIGDGSPENRTVGAHRVSWEIHNGPIPEGMEVCHTCDVKYPPGDKTYRRCVNPAHLFLGTRRDNTRDKTEKGRAVQGERHTSSKLTASQVSRIRAEYSQGGVSFRELAKRYEVTDTAIRFLVRRRTWKGVQ